MIADVDIYLVDLVHYKTSHYMNEYIYQIQTLTIDICPLNQNLINNNHFTTIMNNKYLLYAFRGKIENDITNCQFPTILSDYNAMITMISHILMNKYVLLLGLDRLLH